MRLKSKFSRLLLTYSRSAELQHYQGHYSTLHGQNGQNFHRRGLTSSWLSWSINRQCSNKELLPHKKCFIDWEDTWSASEMIRSWEIMRRSCTGARGFRPERVASCNHRATSNLHPGIHRSLLRALAGSQMWGGKLSLRPRDLCPGSFALHLVQ